MNERYDMIKEQAEFFKQKNTTVHISLNSGKWFNGKITKVDEDRLILEEEILGEILVLFERIIDDGIEPKKENDKGEAKNEM